MLLPILHPVLMFHVSSPLLLPALQPRKMQAGCQRAADERFRVSRGKEPPSSFQTGFKCLDENSWNNQKLNKPHVSRIEEKEEEEELISWQLRSVLMK